MNLVRWKLKLQNINQNFLFVSFVLFSDGFMNKFCLFDMVMYIQIFLLKRKLFNGLVEILVQTCDTYVKTALKTLCFYTSGWLFDKRTNQNPCTSIFHARRLTNKVNHLLDVLIKTKISLSWINSQFLDPCTVSYLSFDLKLRMFNIIVVYTKNHVVVCRGFIRVLSN